MMLDPVTVVAGRGRLAPAWIPGSYVLPRVAYQRLRFFLAARAPVRGGPWLQVVAFDQ